MWVQFRLTAPDWFLQAGYPLESVKIQRVVTQSQGIWFIRWEHRALVPSGTDVYFETI